MIETISVEPSPGLRFTTNVAGPADGTVVLLLHGFPESRTIWDSTVDALGAAGYRAVAPDQRGYSPGARPDPTVGANYIVQALVTDAIGIADLCGANGRPFHLVGHDWGGSLAWGIADTHRHRLASLTVLSRPHPTAFQIAWSDPDGKQKHLSRHHQAFLDPQTARMMIEDDARRLRRLFASHGVADPEIERQLEVVGNEQALDAALAWYRCNTTRPQSGRIQVPTLYVWGDADGTIGPKAAYGTGDWVDAEYRMEILPGVGHFVMDQSPARATELILEHITRHTARTAG